MSLEDLGNLGEFISGLAVLISLVYLATQIRQNTRTLRSQAEDESRNQSAHLQEVMVTDRQIAEMMFSGAIDSDSLDATDRFRFGMLLSNLFMVYENVYLKSNAGMLELDRWPMYERRMAELIRLPGIRAWWDENSGDFQAGFTARVAAIPDRTDTR
jgi:hypothetical protein